MRKDPFLMYKTIENERGREREKEMDSISQLVHLLIGTRSRKLSHVCTIDAMMLLIGTEMDE